MILDCAFGAIREPAELAAQLDGRTGIVEHGLFIELATSDAASLAGHLKLANLCWIYDNNRITIEGHTALTFSEDVATRFLGYCRGSSALPLNGSWPQRRRRSLAKRDL
jgi:hypothetical protein